MKENKVLFIHEASRVGILIVFRIVGHPHRDVDEDIVHGYFNILVIDKNKGSEIVDRFENFINKANKIHNNKYDYTKFKYVNAKTKSTIICPIHGEFEQAPDHHTRKNAIGCPQCISENISKVNKGKKSHKEIADAEYFIKLAHEKFGDKFEFDMSEYNGITKNKIKIKCKIHGWFEKSPRVFIISGLGCNECASDSKNKNKTKPYSQLIEELKLKYNGFYTYPEYNEDTFANRGSKIDIICPKHGVFKKSGTKHLSGQGCSKCNTERLIQEQILVGGYNDMLFSNNEDIANRKGILYFLSINGGEYYKIGITVDLKRRIKGIKHKGKPYIKTIEVISELETTLGEAYKKEQYILDKYKEYRVSLFFSTELFNTDISKLKGFIKHFNN